MGSSRLLNEMFGSLPEEGQASSGLRVTGDKATMGALQDALQEAASLLRDNEDLADWCEKSFKAIAAGIRKGDTVTLPAFQETPDVASFNDDDAGIGPDEEGY